MTTNFRPRGQAPVAKLIRTVAFVIGSVLLFVAVAMGSASFVSVIYGEYETAIGITLAGVVTAGVGGMTRRFVTRPKSITVKEGFATVGLSWFIFSLFGALPYLITGSIPDITNAI
ncbi:MAG TPA: hypothetical protein VMO52_10090, partial [Acidimicrobiia bacterium]|nr:hypothetical protein [Acidimicrobiia bacterium]